MWGAKKTVKLAVREGRFDWTPACWQAHLRVVDVVATTRNRSINIAALNAAELT